MKHISSEHGVIAVMLSRSQARLATNAIADAMLTSIIFERIKAPAQSVP
jgi:hypothetical protein